MNKPATFTAYSIACVRGIPVVIQRGFFLWKDGYTKNAEVRKVSVL